jgi:hypothetical protein
MNFHFRNVNSIFNLGISLLLQAKFYVTLLLCIASLHLGKAITVREMAERCVTKEYKHTKAAMLHSLSEAAVHSTARPRGAPLSFTACHVTCECLSQACLKLASQLGSHFWSVGG